MDFSKTTLLNLDTKKTGGLLNEEERDKINLKNDFKTEVRCHQMELRENYYTSIKNFNECCTNDNSVNFDSKLEQASVVEMALKSPLLKANLSDSKKPVLQLNNDNILTTTNTSSFFQETNKDVSDPTVFQTHITKDAMLDKAEIIEKTSKIIASCSKNSNDNNLKTKKRLHVLMTRNCTEQYWNSSAENTSKNSNTHLLLLSEQNTSCNKSKSLNDATIKKRKYIIDNNETFEEKIRFEEIEDKLEEMFAGIEDEQLINTKTDEENNSKKNNDNNTNNTNQSYDDNCLPYDTSNKSSLSTKAVEKSTALLPFNEYIKQSNSLVQDQEDTIPKSMLYLKTMPHRRRLSIGMNADLLKFAIKSSDELSKTKRTNNDLIREKNIASQSLHLQTQVLRKGRKDAPKNKSNNNNQVNCSEYKGNIACIKSNNRNNNKKNRKAETLSKTKKNQQKIKQRQMERLLSSDNDIEDKPQLTRDIDTKHRSPFILVKNNGNIAVVNTVTADDSNEKMPRSKKTGNYACERKTIKGCHSSTLSNRYDADTADSTWICVFCKIGPHKTGLGDLFGPYIISNKCEEYRFIKNSADLFQNNQRTGVQLLNLSDKTVKYLNDTITDIENNFVYDECNSINNYTFGMPQISDDCYEVWIHEECAIWAPNVFVIGSRLTGLEDATWNSMQYGCAHCLNRGALLCCLQRDCKTTAHVPCARECNWLLDESKFWAYCEKHVKNTL